MFVGEALVGNEAVDQLVKFNRALIDNADTDQQDPHAIDGIILTKLYLLLLLLLLYIAEL